MSLSIPVRVDFAGGWLDVPQYALPGGKIVNCAVSPLINKEKNPYRHGGGVGGSAAWAILNGQDVRTSEEKSGAGWQDEAVIRQTGMCSWMAGPCPTLLHQDSGEWLKGLMLIEWTGKPHKTADLVNHFHDLQTIYRAGNLAYAAHIEQSVEMLAAAIKLSYIAQLGEGMEPLLIGWGHCSLACKYLGSGHGGYALYLYSSQPARDEAVKQITATAVEPGWVFPVEPFYQRP